MGNIEGMQIRIAFRHISIITQSKIAAVHMNPAQIISQALLAKTAVQKFLPAAL